MSTSPSAGDFARLVSDHAALARRVRELELRLSIPTDPIATLRRDLTALARQIDRRLDFHDRMFDIDRRKLKLITESLENVRTLHDLHNTVITAHTDALKAIASVLWPS